MKMQVTMTKVEAEAMLSKAFTAKAANENFEVKSIDWGYGSSVTFTLETPEVPPQVPAGPRSWNDQAAPIHAHGFDAVQRA